MGAPSTQTVTQDVDPDIKDRMLANYSDATDYLNNTPYQPYQGQLIAGQQPWMDASQQYLSDRLFGPGQNLGFQAPTTYGPFGYNPGQMTTNFGGSDPANPEYEVPNANNNYTPPPGGWSNQDPTDDNEIPVGMYDGQGTLNDPNGGQTPTTGSGGGPYNPDIQMSQMQYAQVGPQAPPPITETADNLNPGGPSPVSWGDSRVQPQGPPTYGGGGGSYTPNNFQTVAEQANMAAQGGAAGAMGYNPSMVNPGTAQGYGDIQSQNVGAGMVGAQSGAQGMGQYQNPWEQQVVQGALDDQARGEAMFREGGIYSKGTGTYGGDRQAVQVGEANRNFADRQGLLSAQLRSQGFNTAAANAQADASRYLQAGGMNQGAGLNAQMANQSAGLRAGLANQGAYNNMAQYNTGLNMQGQLANQQAGLAGAGLNLQGAGALGALGQQSLDQTMQIGGQAGQLGMYNQQQAQNMIDADMNQYDQARNDPLRRFGLLQGIASGIPVGMNQTMTSNPNTFSQIGGMLLGGLGAAGGLGWSPFGGSNG